MISVDNINQAFPHYPITIADKGWIYGVWYCGTSWQKASLYGQYPPGFLRRALALFPDAKDILHCPSGTVTGPGVTVDSVSDGIRCPQIIASADVLPFPDESFDVILSDPPYSTEDSKKYGCPPFPLGRFIKEAHRILRPGGHLGMLHVYYPSYRRKEWKLEALIMVITGFLRRARVFSILTKRQVDKAYPAAGEGVQRDLPFNPFDLDELCRGLNEGARIMQTTREEAETMGLKVHGLIKLGSSGFHTSRAFSTGKAARWF